ncbi:murein L,D-transpeptidase family protein [Salipiger sp. PrR002]|uniref:L,D-transpeptidase family protein n=1 Tax=Salipiger sp. PrR002 TaxID=2706489 RepID=UPI0013B9624F|nr:L,D-transpeptidase family protein [Salipiger sp. PrR002]NDV98220.1 L,D-transpeptidase family protein [Salipiger sp. PrR002]NDW54932.1 L,D-transpeptidase family protein [Salipiger sp. PrR004]
MYIGRHLMVLAAVLLLAACGGGQPESRFKTYRGPAVTHVVVHKGARKMYLLHHDQIMKVYNVGLGFSPEGDKKVEGDGKTPEGLYFIDRRNPNSRFHLSLGIDYPNAADRAEARYLGKSPGGDIFIHGRPAAYQNGIWDWTWGCIAVTDSEMEDIYSMIRTDNPTPILIMP